jgi:hypothetical protein
MRLFLLLFVACAPADLDLGVDLVPGEPDTDTDADADTDTDTDTDVEPEPPVEVDFSVWDGRRTLTRGNCAGVFAEEGEELGEDWEYYDGAKDLCPECDHFYYVTGSPSYICDVPMYTEFYRALSVGDDGEVDVLYWSDGDYDYVPLADNGLLEELELTYSYTWPYGDQDLEFEGVLNFEELD